MADYDYLPVSNGSGDAALMNITAARIIGGTTITVDSTTNIPTKFIGTYGTLLATNLIDPTTKRDFKGHVIDATHIGIDAFEPGSTDSANLATGQIVVVKPNTGWGNRVATFIKNATGFGTPENVTFAQITGTSLVNALHNHQNAAGGGKLTGASAITVNTVFANILGLSNALDPTNGVQHATNAGSAGGDIWYINLGGIKLMWGTTASCSGTGSPSFQITFPAFFTTVQMAQVLTNPNTNVQTVAAVAGFATTNLTFYIFKTDTPGAGASIVNAAYWFVIGT